MAVALPKGNYTKTGSVAMEVMDKISEQLLPQPEYWFHCDNFIAGHGNREPGAYVQNALDTIKLVRRAAP